MITIATAADFCTPDRKVRSNYYSDTYRAVFTLYGVRQEWDIQHIGIPFPAEKEIAFRIRFGLDGESLNAYYRSLAANVRNHAQILETIRRAGDPAADRSTLYYRKTGVFHRENRSGTDIYLISEPAEQLTDSDVIRSGASTLHNILGLGVRLLQTLKIYHEIGICAGTLDLDSFVLVREGEKVLIRDGFFYFGTDGRSSPVLTPDAFAFLPEDVRTGNSPVSPDSDVYALCALLWSMLSGRSYTETPDLSRTPVFAGDELTEALREGLENGAAARARLNRALREALKTSQDCVVRFEEPPWKADQDAAVAEYLRYHPVNTEQEDEDEDSDGEEELESDPDIFWNRMTRTQKALTLIGTVLLSLLVMTGSLYRGKYLGETSLPPAVPAPVQEEPAEQIEETGTVPEKPEITPVPVQTMTPVRNEEYPLLELDSSYEWFRSEYPPEDFGAILFQNTYEHRSELIEKWNFRIGDHSIECYVYPMPETGAKVLVIAGNGSGRIRVNRTQRELSEYMQYRFPCAVLSGLEVLMSTGSTPFTVPVPESNVSDTEEPPAEEPDTEQEFTSETPETKLSESEGFETSLSDSAGTVVRPQSGVQMEVPDWDREDWTSTGQWVEGASQAGTESSGYQIVAHRFSLEADCTDCTAGSVVRVRLTGDVSGTVRIWSSDSALASVSDTPDPDGSFRVSCIGSGSVEIYGSCDWGTVSRTLRIR